MGGPPASGLGVRVLQTRHRETKSTDPHCHTRPRILADHLPSDRHDSGDAGTGFVAGGA